MKKYHLLTAFTLATFFNVIVLNSPISVFDTVTKKTDKIYYAIGTANGFFWTDRRPDPNNFVCAFANRGACEVIASFDLTNYPNEIPKGVTTINGKGFIYVLAN